MPFLHFSLFVDFLKVHLSSGKWGKKMPSFRRMPCQLQASHFSSYNLQAYCYEDGSPLLIAAIAYSCRSCTNSP